MYYNFIWALPPPARSPTKFEDKSGDLSDSNLRRFPRRISREKRVRSKKRRQRRKDELKLYGVPKHEALSEVRLRTRARQNLLKSPLNFVLNSIKSLLNFAKASSSVLKRIQPSAEGVRRRDYIKIRFDCFWIPYKLHRCWDKSTRSAAGSFPAEDPLAFFGKYLENESYDWKTEASARTAKSRSMTSSNMKPTSQGVRRQTSHNRSMVAVLVVTARLGGWT